MCWIVTILEREEFYLSVKRKKTRIIMTEAKTAAVDLVPTVEGETIASAIERMTEDLIVPREEVKAAIDSIIEETTMNRGATQIRGMP
jgi:hypothetical protein